MPDFLSRRDRPNSGRESSSQSETCDGSGLVLGATNRTAEGIVIRTESGGSALDSIRVNREGDSKEADLTEWHEQKEEEQRISTLRGIKTD
jgi:hypothetical protein